MNARVITSAMILAVMKPGQSYHAKGIAEMFGIGSPEMRRMLNAAAEEGVISRDIIGGVQLYSRPTERGPMTALRKLRISPEMKRALERCKELRVHPSRFDL
jgi:hypothetical protein